MFNKKGQGMSTNTIILLILGLIVLIALIWGFSTGWQGVKNLVNTDNVDAVVGDCALACSLNNQYSYCLGERTLKAPEDNLEIKSSCLVFATASEFKRYGVANCPQIECSKTCTDYQVNGVAGKEASSGKYDLQTYLQKQCTFASA